MEEGLFQRSLDIDQSQSSYESMEQSEFSLPSNDQSESGIFTSKGDNSDTDEEEKESYYFESDHVALKDNRDYQVLLRTIALLEAQRIQAVHDLDKLYEGRQEALADPIHHRHMTRLKKQLKEGNGQEPEDVKVKSMTFDGEDKALIRGRIKTEEKPVTFNQLWTAEEQKRCALIFMPTLSEMLLSSQVLTYNFEMFPASSGSRLEELLIEFPPEEVQSRVQKYFIKLAKAGLPIPGRIPHSVNFKKKDEEGVPIELRGTREYQELMRLKHLKKMKTRASGLCKTEHVGFKCDSCQCEPIVGTRWHCTDCPPDDAVDFCDNCVERSLLKLLLLGLCCDGSKVFVNAFATGLVLHGNKLLLLGLSCMAARSLLKLLLLGFTCIGSKVFVKAFATGLVLHGSKVFIKAFATGLVLHGSKVFIKAFATGLVLHWQQAFATGLVLHVSKVFVKAFATGLVLHGSKVFVKAFATGLVLHGSKVFVKAFATGLVLHGSKVFVKAFATGLVLHGSKIFVKAFATGLVLHGSKIFVKAFATGLVLHGSKVFVKAFATGLVLHGSKVFVKAFATGLVLHGSKLLLLDLSCIGSKVFVKAFATGLVLHGSKVFVKASASGLALHGSKVFVKASATGLVLHGSKVFVKAFATGLVLHGSKVFVKAFATGLVLHGSKVFVKAFATGLVLQWQQCIC
ncbi:ZZZ3-like protein [Mya arenaria]|uniref:ZZZ3-like protein n=1 Tax=Mya arenaria TaxID=6604 RepID=A0ABY7GBZ0_MYAAR|nr:ZZZ3-like protein [Mya arenaria]